MQSDKYVEDVFAINRFLLRGAGLWFPDSQSKWVQICYKIYAAIVLLYVNIFYTSTEFIKLFYTYEDQYAFIKNVNFFLTHGMGNVKVAFWFLKGHVLRQLMATLEDERLRYVGCKSCNYNPGGIWTKYKKISFQYTFSFIVLSHVTLSLAYLPRLITAIFNPPENGNAFYQILPYYCWTPFDHSTPASYIMALLFQMGPAFNYCYSIIGMDSLFMNLMNFVAAHFTILQGAFRSCKSRVLERLSAEGEDIHCELLLQNAMITETNKHYKHLQIILRVCANLEEVYKFLTLSQAMATLFIFCTSLFLITTTPVLSKQFFTEILYIMCIGLQLYMYCWFGNEVTLSARDIPFSIWSADWFDCCESFKKNMLIAMAKMQKPVYMTVGKFAPLTLQTLVWVMKTSYSFFTVIKTTDK